MQVSENDGPPVHDGQALVGVGTAVRHQFRHGHDQRGQHQTILQELLGYTGLEGEGMTDAFFAIHSG